MANGARLRALSLVVPGFKSQPSHSFFGVIYREQVFAPKLKLVPLKHNIFKYHICYLYIEKWEIC